MAFTPEEIANIANAAMEWYYTPDNLTPLERSRRRLKQARRALKAAEAELKAALENSAEVRRLPYAERHERWTSSKPGTQLFIRSETKPSLLHDLKDLLPKKQDASGP